MKQMTIHTATKTDGAALQKLPILSATTGSFYFHIPFCRKKCPYCHFYVTGYNPAHVDEYMHALKLEWEMRGGAFEQIPSIYFGGGTPFLAGPDNIAKILSWTGLADEVTLEANPEDITYDLMKAYREAGINRVSIGVQSLVDSSLITIGRAHRKAATIEAIEATHRAGIENITIDLMYDLPDQTLDSFEDTLKAIEHLPITHLSLYNMTIEPNTAFYRKRESLQLPTETESSAMLEMAVTYLENYGFRRYEISAFAKPGYESNHNLGYWQGRPFLGLGPSAFSYTNGSRHRNVANWRQWAKALECGEDPTDFLETLPYPENMKELLTIHLRIADGISLDRFESLPQETLDEIDKLINEGFLTQTNTLQLTAKGQTFYDTVASRLI